MDEQNQNNLDGVSSGDQPPQSPTPTVMDSPSPTDPEPPMVNQPEKLPGSKTKMIAIVASAVLLLVGAVFGWLWWQGHSDEPASNTATSETEEDALELACPDGFTQYSNAELNIKFCHPAEWGAVSVNDAKFAEADTGQRWRISFEDKSEVAVGLATPDWATELGRGGACSDPAVSIADMATAYPSFNLDWQTNEDDGVDGEITFASRDTSHQLGVYHISESVDVMLTNGVCITGYKALGGDLFESATASLNVMFEESGAVTTVAQHIASPNQVVSVRDRNDFAELVKSIELLVEPATAPVEES